jgi:hypothetical protein
MPNWKRSRASWATRHRAPQENAPEPLAVCTTRPDQPRFNMYDMLLVCGAVQHATGYEISWEPCYEGGLADGVLRLPRGTALSSAGCVCSPRTAVAHRSRGVSAPPCVRASSATGTLVHEHPSLGAPLDLELPSANGRVYEASPGRTALCTSASVPRARVVGKSTTFRITRASPLSPTHHRKCSPTRRRPPCSRVPTNAPLLGSASSWLGGCGLRRTATRRGGAMCNEQSSLAYCVLARRQEGAGGRAPCHGRGTLQYTGLVLIFTRSLQ